MKMMEMAAEDMAALAAEEVATHLVAMQATAAEAEMEETAEHMAAAEAVGALPEGHMELEDAVATVAHMVVAAEEVVANSDMTEQTKHITEWEMELLAELVELMAEMAVAIKADRLRLRHKMEQIQLA